MNTRAQSRQAWRSVRARLETSGGRANVPKALFPHPRDAGALPSTTWPIGQIADYTLDDGSGKPPLAILEFPDRFEAFVDSSHLATQVLGAVERDPSKAMYVGAAMLGGAIGTSVSNRRGGMFLGAGLGLLFAALLDSSSPPARRSGG
ncbi:MAG: hypothetical protein U0263_20385 [Polyangiaceae bacterium]